jgi:hypothetical protein
MDQVNVSHAKPLLAGGMHTSAFNPNDALWKEK